MERKRKRETDKKNHREPIELGRRLTGLSALLGIWCFATNRLDGVPPRELPLKEADIAANGREINKSTFFF